MRSSRIMQRARIEKELDNLFNYPLTIVSATMGYGKTTTVKSYLGDHGVKTEWVSLLGSDGVVEVFWKKLSEAVERLCPEVGVQLAQLGFPLDALQMSMVIDIIKKMDDGKTSILVIDDYQIIDGNEQVNKLLELIVQEDILGLHVVLISRTRPRFNHINLLSKRLCYYIDTNTFAFNMQEIKEYFELMHCEVSLSDMERIYDYTKGWISAVFLMLLGLRRGIPVDENSNINQLVENNLFFTLDNSTQDILLRLSVFESFTLRQATFVMGDSNVSQVVKQLMEQNAFIEYDGKTGLYKLHNVLLDFLREKLENSGIDISGLHHRTGMWFIEQGDELQAFDFYYKAGKIEELLEGLNHPDMINISYLGYKLHQKIHSELQKDLCIRYPFPFLQMACNFIVSNEEEAVMQGVEIANTMWEYFSVNEDIPQKLRNKILGELEIINIFMVFNDAQKMVEHAAKAYEFLEGGISSIIFRNSEFAFGIPHFLYIYYREPGKLKKTLDIIAEGFPPSVFDGCGTGCEDLALAEYALETGDVQNAELYAQKSIFRAKTKMQTGIIICANFALIRLRLLSGSFTQAKELLAQTRELLVHSRHEMMAQSNAIYNTTMDVCEGYVYGCLKEPELIPEWLRNGDMSKGAFLMQGMAFPCIIIAKGAMLSGNWVQLEVLCESFKEGYGVLHNQLGLLHNSIYEAVAKYNLYGMEAGMDSLLPAIREAQADGILLPFAENADFILPMLHSLRGKEELDSLWLERLIEVCRQYSKNLQVRDQTEALLTRREAEVLELLAQGLTQKEIAEKLYLSVSAVKRHLESMYIKLEANNKIAAIEKARSLNIL